MIIVQIKVKDLLNNLVWGDYCDYRDWNPYILNEGRISEDDWVEVPLEKLQEWGVHNEQALCNNQKK